MIYIYRRRPSDSARFLAEGMALNTRFIRQLQSPHHNQGLRAGDHLICWGERVAPIEGVKILNGGPLSNKFEDAIKLKQENIPTITASLQAGAVNRVQPLQRRLEQTGRNLQMEIAQDPLPPRFRDTLNQFSREAGELLVALDAPVDQRIWLPRMNAHVGGNDLLAPPPRPDFFVLKENLVEEYRIHSFLSKSIRAGKKLPRPEVPHVHEWIRSFDGGWKIVYDDFHSRAKMRDLASRAVKALGLDFGAVDIGKKSDGSLMVLEVNRAPGLEGNTISAYANAIKNWVEEG